VQADTKARAFWASKNFVVYHDGYVYMRQATIGNSTNGNNRIFIAAAEDKDDESAIFTYQHRSFDSKGKGFYLGSNGLSLDKTFSVSD